MLSPQQLENVFTNNSVDGKWIIDEFGDLVEIPNTQLPIQYHPTTFECLGVLCEPPTTNYYPFAFDMSGGLALSSGVNISNTVGANSILFFPQALMFDGSVDNKSATFSFNAPVSWFYVGISFFVRFPNGGTPPNYGRSYINDTDFHFLINGLEAIDASGEIKVNEMKDGSYWVRARIKSPSRPINDITIGTSKWQSNRTFLIAGLQIEPYSCTSPILTEGEIGTRDGNYISFDAEYNSTMNPEQGTLELGYYLNHGSVGSALYAYSDDETWELGHIGESYDNPEIESDAYAISVDNPTYSFKTIDYEEDVDLTKWNKSHQLKFTYSPYGNRYTSNNSLVFKQKDFRYNKNNTPPTHFKFGISKDGTYMNGYIEYFNIRGRALTDEEMINV